MSLYLTCPSPRVGRQVMTVMSNNYSIACVDCHTTTGPPGPKLKLILPATPWTIPLVSCLDKKAQLVTGGLGLLDEHPAHLR